MRQTLDVFEAEIMAELGDWAGLEKAIEVTSE